jgi:hypothetical protein
VIACSALLLGRAGAGQRDRQRVRGGEAVGERCCARLGVRVVSAARLVIRAYGQGPGLAGGARGRPAGCTGGERQAVQVGAAGPRDVLGLIVPCVRARVACAAGEKDLDVGRRLGRPVKGEIELKRRLEDRLICQALTGLHGEHVLARRRLLLPAHACPHLVVVRVTDN